MSAVGFLIWIGLLIAIAVAGLVWGVDTRPTAVDPPEFAFRHRS